MKKISLLILVLSSLSLLGQDLNRLIPKTASIVVSSDGASIDRKLPFEKIEGLEMFFEIKKEMKKSFFNDKDPNEISFLDMGIKHNETSYFVVEKNDSVSYFQLIFPINDENKLKEIFAKKKEIQKDERGNNFFESNGSIFQWNKEYGIFIGANTESSYFRNNNDIYARYGIEVDSNASYWKLWDERKLIESFWIKEKLKNLEHLTVDNSILSVPSYKSADVLQYDICAWTSSELMIANNLRPLLGRYKFLQGNEAFNTSLSDLVKDNASWFGLTFKDDEIELHSESYLNPKAKKYFNNIQKAKINGKFASYASQSNPLAYYGLALNPKAVIEGAHEYYNDLLNNIPIYGSTVNDVWKLLIDIVIDEDALFEVFQGDMLLLLNDIKPVEVSYSTYTYDENFNATEVMKTKQQEMPLVTLMMSTKKEHMDRILSIASLSKFIEKNGDYYKSTKKASKDLNIYMMVKDDILFITNEEAMVQKLSNNESLTKLSGKHASALKKNNNTLYLDLKSLLMKMPVQKHMRDKHKKMYEHVINSTGEISLKGLNKTKNGFYSTLTLDLPSQDINSYEFLMNFINDLYKIEGGIE